MKLILVGGSIANGKSTLSTRLSKELGIARVAMDNIKEGFFDLFGCRDREWSREIGAIAFPVFQQMIELHLRRGESVVAEATFLWIEDIEWIHNLADRYGAQIVLVWMHCDPRVARERFLSRARTGYHPGHCHAAEDVLAEFNERYFNRSFIPLPIRGRTIVVDTTDLSSIDHDVIRTFVCD